MFCSITGPNRVQLTCSHLVEKGHRGSSVDDKKHRWWELGTWVTRDVYWMNRNVYPHSMHCCSSIINDQTIDFISFLIYIIAFILEFWLICKVVLKILNCISKPRIFFLEKLSHDTKKLVNNSWKKNISM